MIAWVTDVTTTVMVISLTKHTSIPMVATVTNGIECLLLRTHPLV
jgi:hypothetical protein